MSIFLNSSGFCRLNTRRYSEQARPILRAFHELEVFEHGLRIPLPPAAPDPPEQ